MLETLFPFLVGQTADASVSGASQALVLSAAVAGFCTGLLKKSLWPKLDPRIRVVVPLVLGAVAAIAYCLYAGVPWPDAVVIALTSGPLATGVREGAVHVRSVPKPTPGPMTFVLALLMAPQLTGCASFPEVRPYDGENRSGEELCAGITAAAEETASANFYGGMTASLVGGATLATMAAIPDDNLKAGEVPGSAIRAGSAFLAGGLVALGVYLVLGASDLDALAADTKAALVFGDGESVGLERDQVAWSMCMDSWSAYDDAGSKRRVDQIAPVE